MTALFLILMICQSSKQPNLIYVKNDRHDNADRFFWELQSLMSFSLAIVTGRVR
jgi:hypothetical protein